VLATVHACITHTHIPNRKNQTIQASIAAYKLENHETKMVQVTITPDKEVQASLTWDTLV